MKKSTKKDQKNPTTTTKKLEKSLKKFTQKKIVKVSLNAAKINKKHVVTYK